MNALLRTIVVDDEDRARRRLLRMLASLPEVECVGEASGGTDAIALIRRQTPDLIFLDVQMPDMDGFEVLNALAKMPRYVVFATAFDRFAIQAFGVGALDYLLKPFDEGDVQRAVARALERDASERFLKGYERALTALQKPKFLERIPVTYLKDILLVPVATVTHFEADNELVSLHASGAVYTTDMTLAELEQRLDPERFFRAHRNAIISLERVIRLERADGTRFVAVLGDGIRVEMSRTSSKRLREILGI